MGDMCYRPLIEDMEFSYSRLKSFKDCPYRWYLQYIRNQPQEPTFFASFGVFVHELIARKIQGEPTDRLALEYLTGFRGRVRGPPPNTKVFNSYFQAGLEAIRRPLELPCKALEVETRYHFQVEEMPIQGVVDLIGRSEDDAFVIVDHKSRALKPRSGRKKPTKYDQELDEYLRQLYLYAIPIFEKYGELPSELVFNCYRSGDTIREPFTPEGFSDAKQWALGTYHEILDASDFPPDIEFFKCSYLCQQKSNCEYYQLNFEG